MPSNN